MSVIRVTGYDPTTDRELTNKALQVVALAQAVNLATAVYRADPTDERATQLNAAWRDLREAAEDGQEYVLCAMVVPREVADHADPLPPPA